MKIDQDTVYIYSDGACANKSTNLGAWCCIVKYKNKEYIVEGKEENSTNQRMEVAGITTCLPYILKHHKNIKIITDSMYVVWGINEREKWKRKKKGYSNTDLWNPIYNMIDTYKPQIKAEWVKGHNGHTENERCDEIAKKLSKGFPEFGWK